MSVKILGKSKGFYDTYERRPGSNKEQTHYCPGCGHGILHKMIAEALVDFEVAENMVFISPVGCSVFAYYYFNAGNIQAAHGRAPAVATGVKRALPESIVISYQGDGDLAAIGGNEILHAANRGESMTVFFVNNAIYGMTGGQMAPTTLIGQKTTTTPYGRTLQNEGYPIKMAEIIASLESPVYVERVMLADVRSKNAARKAVRKGIRNQIEKKGFSFIEVLSTCPTGWKMTAPQSEEWIKTTLVENFPLGVYKDIADQVEPLDLSSNLAPTERVPKLIGLEQDKMEFDTAAMKIAPQIDQEIKIAGFGGQGVLSLGVWLSEIGMREDLQVSWIPSYGPEMRGGTANCHVKLSRNNIGSPLVTHPTVLVAMNRPSLEKFEGDVVDGGAIVWDSSLIDVEPQRKDIRNIPVPATKIAKDLGNSRVSNVVLLGVMAGFSDFLDPLVVQRVLPLIFKKKHLLEINLIAFQKGLELGRELSD
ncbi:MAG: 2-ketoisovalerate ferredoxin oxidoreductase [Candidatus Marinimicrobia bacterium]|jgi:2-oxoisovalerate ferredoxin oxidoreductase beta subunit|nr:2-ketoisovalerate ferredoxin oxidoreductase [Candidatus Neomarinimicrobiota bacterium]MBT3631978.1 2-ketoisovalerate ferredoxin oxidoreductase [Candidatus Neomarinimicrobiota bacterium]MBT3824564.1 2-ketoisovalerate ferredoxin oxidoreductase [Candidatus Neomarinimicrobiota bacterium]MBT4130261.1 2-ketoisovalerate ferredoxin oxidoreductase [Candidatus Neomarinimicrobiota bacterium]MBT4297012.1 2-ketoisovalerate ferredoxin oxidoreductase [Candidatus Neomarinimicrobiota bacterium]